MTLQRLAYALQPRLAKVAQKQRVIRWITKKKISGGPGVKTVAPSGETFSNPATCDKENIVSIYHDIATQSVASNGGKEGGPRRPSVALRKRILSVSSENVEVGIDMLRKVTSQFPEDSWACVELGTILAGKLGDFELSFIYFAMAAARGSGVGTLCLGDQLLRGLGVSQDIALGGLLVARAKEVLNPTIREPLQGTKDSTLGGRLATRGDEVLNPNVGEPPQVEQNQTLGGRLVARVKEVMQPYIRIPPLPAKPRLKWVKDGGTRRCSTPARHAPRKPKNRIAKRERFHH
mmetsp:Transcript_21149/g.51637  ORF Transcript_21149/g.51637 Transcript_21149/m.51637 type:complete len:291 (-) Transcript_21149:115-987(-)|eukprot:CAMPEP_0198322840 /NCGR_PEP_ID=MMETSP1450-20131203/11232_1 /TAXON_ID=753684 ORGANISM="Madagascaria erythrocladiodes, Strain CCMP3234" /NCGR_SAMPLE_ID=MMETSP1450 /ASSEMBLY_ACC=CAM_ASM_001115 /LENGTH=290 /DNA_ID=CAMNT_0044026495 /DNA_START=352 /DNA_END=1224 /DNA_ORIENTATION=+